MSIDNLRFNGQAGLGDYAINVKNPADFDTLSVNRSDFTGFDFDAIIVSGNETTNVSAFVDDNVNISNSTFSNNGVAGGGGTGDIQLFVYNGNASLSNLTLIGDWVGTNGGRTGIQFRGVGTGAGVEIVPSGTISLDNIDISGTYVTQMIGIQRYSDVSGFSFNNVRLGGGSSDITGTFGAALRIDAVGDSATKGTPGEKTLDIGNTYFRGLTGPRSDIEIAPDNTLPGCVLIN